MMRLKEANTLAKPHQTPDEPRQVVSSLLGQARNWPLYAKMSLFTGVRPKDTCTTPVAAQGPKDFDQEHRWYSQKSVFFFSHVALMNS